MNVVVNNYFGIFRAHDWREAMLRVEVAERVGMSLGVSEELSSAFAGAGEEGRFSTGDFVGKAKRLSGRMFSKLFL